MKAAVLTCALLLITAACGGGADTESSGNDFYDADGRPLTHTLSGTMRLPLDDSTTAGMPLAKCRGAGGYDDMRVGAQVTVKDEAETLIGTGSLREGVALYASDVCEFTFQVASVPAAEFYTIEISHRGGLTYSNDELQRQGWSVALTLGD